MTVPVHMVIIWVAVQTGVYTLICISDFWVHVHWNVWRPSVLKLKMGNVTGNAEVGGRGK